MVDFDAADARVPAPEMVTPAWVDLIDIVTGESETLDVFDGGPYANGETFQVQWSPDGIRTSDDI